MSHPFTLHPTPSIFPYSRASTSSFTASQHVPKPRIHRETQSFRNPHSPQLKHHFLAMFRKSLLSRSSRTHQPTRSSLSTKFSDSSRHSNLLDTAKQQTTYLPCENPAREQRETIPLDGGTTLKSSRVRDISSQDTRIPSNSNIPITPDWISRFLETSPLYAYPSSSSETPSLQLSPHIHHHPEQMLSLHPPPIITRLATLLATLQSYYYIHGLSDYDPTILSDIERLRPKLLAAKREWERLGVWEGKMGRAVDGGEGIWMGAEKGCGGWNGLCGVMDEKGFKEVVEEVLGEVEVLVREAEGVFRGRGLGL
ncbi:hypothetical protein IAQ61_000730 [Plenodomus lingam]|uniref:uncharacterized protein n=1 Tax=Leptosphaeria maculans TaxID=5022 RepID=UPI00331A1DE3|nr:hypothetical protein IAQ61_000730 [Plenodomus lingam]